MMLCWLLHNDKMIASQLLCMYKICYFLVNVDEMNC